jgi:GLPGLI family protein
MKKYLFCLSCLACFYLNAQTLSAGYTINYKVSLRFGAIRNFVGVLNTSTDRADFRFKELIDMPSSVSKEKNVINFELKDTTENVIQTNLRTGELLEITRLPPEKNYYLVQDSVVKIEWKILEETKIVNSHTLSKAIGEFRGRQYTAWFAQDIPCVFGPWKFHGLPGVVFEISDAKREVEFLLTKISSLPNFQFNNPPKGLLISRSDFKKKQSSLADDISKALLSKLGREFTVEVKVKNVKQIELD